MAKSADRIIIDTNLWISFLLMKDYCKLDAIFANGLATLIFSAELLEEFVGVAQKQKFKKYFSPEDLQELLLKISERADFIKVHSKVALCRDPKDDFLLALAKDGNADYLITGDKDLLDLKEFGRTKIISIAEYLSKK